MAPKIRPASPIDKSAKYHHGDLRRVLIEAALALLAERKYWDFSLREVARQAGVSHNAPYNHFPDKRALLTAIATAGFESLRVQTQPLSRDSGDPENTLGALAKAYVAFGIRHPAQYRLMFGSTLATSGEGLPSEVKEAATSAKAVLADAIRRGAESSQFAFSPTNRSAVDVAVLSAWALVHGLTMLAIDGLVREPIRPDAMKALVENVAQTLLFGLNRR